MRTKTMTCAALLAGAGALIVPSLASAHTVAVTCTDGRVVANGAAFPSSPLVTSARLSVDGVQGPFIPISPGIPGPNPTYTFPEPLYGDHTLVVQFVNGGPWTSPATQVVCGEAPTPTPPPIPPTPEVTPPPPVQSVVVVQPVPVKKVVKKHKAKRRVITCAFLRKHHAGPRSYARRGWYYRCKPPVQKRLGRIPVTG